MDNFKITRLHIDVLKDIEDVTNVLEPDELDDVMATLGVDDFYALKRFSVNSCLYSYLLDWYGREEYGYEVAIANMFKGIKHAGEVDGFIYYTTGLGYDSISDDLLNLPNSQDARHYFTNVFAYGLRRGPVEDDRLAQNILYKKQN